MPNEISINSARAQYAHILRQCDRDIMRHAHAHVLWVDDHRWVFEFPEDGDIQITVFDCFSDEPEIVAHSVAYR
jgi:hypothetical protein